jgi:hypothetical protein
MAVAADGDGMALAQGQRMKALIETIKSRPTVVAWTIGLLVVGTLAYYLISALLMPDNPADLGQPQITMSKVQAQGEHGTQLGWRFVADSSQTSTDGMLTTYRHVRDGTYYLKGTPAYKISADQVVVDLRSMNYTASGSVHVWSVLPRDLSDLRTENLSWNNPLQTLVCPSQVRAKYKGYEMETTRLQANLLSGISSLGSTSIKGNG